MTISIVGTPEMEAAPGGGYATSFGSGWTDLDVHLIFEMYKATTNGIATPASYTDLHSQAGTQTFLRVCARILAAGNTPPTVSTAAGSGAVGSVTIRGLLADLSQVVEDVQFATNTSQTQINYPGLTIATPGCLILTIGVYNTNSGSDIANPSTMVAPNELNDDLGTALRVAWFTDLQAAAANLSAGHMTITGGATSQTVRGICLALRPSLSSGGIILLSPDGNAGMSQAQGGLN